MTHEEIIAMANEAGLNSYRIPPSQAVEVWTRFAALVAAKEREACARIAAGQWSNVAEKLYGIECAAAIRGRGQKDAGDV